MSINRSRSVSRSRITKLNDIFPSGESLDPLALLSDLLPNINNLDIPLNVNITDGEKAVSFLLSNFIKREYEVVGTYVKFGFVRLNVSKLKVNISFDLMVVEGEQGSS